MLSHWNSRTYLHHRGRGESGLLPDLVDIESRQEVVVVLARNPLKFAGEGRHLFYPKKIFPGKENEKTLAIPYKSNVLT